MKAVILPPYQQFGGIDDDTQPLLPATDEKQRLTASAATNVIIDQRTRELVRSPGSKAFASVAAGGPIKGIFEYIHAAGEKSIFIRTRTGYWRWSESSAAWVSMHAATVVLTDSEAVPSWAQLGSYLTVVDGERAYCWDGVSDTFQDWRAGGIEAPRYTTGVASSTYRPQIEYASGQTFETGASHQFFYTLYNSTTGEESPPSKVMGTMFQAQIGGTAKRDVTIKTGYAAVGTGNTADGVRGNGFGLWTLPAGVTHLRVYRSDNRIPTVYYRTTAASGGILAVDSASFTEGQELVATITTTGRETTAFSSWIGPPQGVTVVREHGQRLFVCGSPMFPNRLWWTEPGELNFSSSNWLMVGRTDDPIMSVFSFPLQSPTLGILCRHSTWTLTGYDNTTFAAGLRQVAQGPGLISPHLAATANGKAYFLGALGAYVFDGLTVERIDKGVQKLLRTAIDPVEALA